MSKQSVVINTVEDIDALVWTSNHFSDHHNFSALDTFIKERCSTLAQVKDALTKVSRKLGDMSVLTDEDAIEYLDIIGVQLDSTVVQHT